MIYLDVTSSCKSPMNTGVQRVVRGLFRSLSALTPVTPMIWDTGLTCYSSLSPRERSFLENPFHSGRASDAEPGRRANPIPVWSKLARRVLHRWNRLDLSCLLTAADTLFVPEIFQDNRVEWLPALAGRTPARRVALCHDLINVRRPDITPPARQGNFSDYLNALSAFDHVAAVSRATADDLLAFWCEHERVCTPPPLCVCHLAVANAAEARPLAAPPAAASRRSILCVGTFEPRKNHLTLLDAADLLWRRGVDFDLVLIGRTTAQWGDRVLASVRALQAAGRPLRWLRHVDDQTLRRAYAECAFTVFPTLIEGFGLPILESLWHGRPCVCGTNGALGEVSAGGGCLPVDQTDPSALASAMERLLTDAPLYQQLFREAETRCFDTWENLAARLLPILEVTPRPWP